MGRQLRQLAVFIEAVFAMQHTGFEGALLRYNTVLIEPRLAINFTIGNSIFRLGIPGLVAINVNPVLGLRAGFCAAAASVIRCDP